MDLPLFRGYQEVVGNFGYMVKGGASLEMEGFALTSTLLMFLTAHLAHEL